MTERIPGTRSPMLKNGVLTWCAGDAFTFTLKLCLSALGEELSDLTGYAVETSFYDAGGAAVHTFEGEGDSSRLFQMDFTPEVSGKFPRGRYLYDVSVTSPEGYRSTVANDVPASVI